MGASTHLPTQELIERWPHFTIVDPLRILVSGCLAGLSVGYDGSTYGSHPRIADLISLPNVRATPFCPEDFSFGTPRSVCDISGGDGFDVLAGRARVLNAEGDDWTEGMIKAAYQMLATVREKEIRLAVLMDISAACGSQVIYKGARLAAGYQASKGVCAALLVQEGIPVVSQRDFKTLHRIARKLDPSLESGNARCDHHETEWYRSYFGRNT